jgi:hypothetical protein
VPATTQCTLVPQGGCPPGHTCALAGSSNETSCYGAGAIPTGSACQSLFDCAPGDICLFGACSPVCAADADCKGPGARCVQVRDASNQPIAGYEACSSQCNPVDPENQAHAPGFAACGPSLNCDTDSAVQGATVCAQAGSAGAGQSCTSQNDVCAPSLVCLHNPQAMTATCTPYCLKGAGAGCSSGSCQSFAVMQYVVTASGMIEVGYCG